MTSLAKGHLGVFIQALDCNVHYREYEGTWSAWQNMDGVKTRYDPVVILRSAKTRKFDIFIVGFDHCLYHRGWQTGQGWAKDWTKIATNCLGPPAVVSRDNDKFIELAYVSTDHSLKHKRLEENQTWCPAGTETMDWGGKYIYNRGSACSWSTDHVSFFFIGMDSKCYEKRWVRGIEGWNDFELPGIWTIPPRALSQYKYEQKMTVYGLNEESKLFYCGRTGAGDVGGWNHTVFDDGTYSKEIPEAVSFGDSARRIDVFVVGLDSSIYQKTWTKATGWKDAKKIGGNTIYAPRAVSWGDSSVTRYDLFAVGRDFSMWHLFSNDGDKWLPGDAIWESLGGKMATMAGGKV
ncbi:hypothetical protein TWF703_004016 [Orbilia oligospora]|uniref:PLL-like beta propeller domain-containing protein n=2 Tax=Orbilia oligospora TaxID=2813651 RepID=A0A7C8K5B2_ORBOL|nr:hypothetical protein TWF703_004016 [Orbilia oligospora]